MRRIAISWLMLCGVLFAAWQMQTPAAAQCSNMLGVFNCQTPASGCGYLTQSCAIFAAFTTPPTTSRKVIINTLVNALLNGSTDTWDKMDVLYVMAAADSQAASINWKNPGTTTLANIGSPTFTTDTVFFLMVHQVL
jgi:hypothetical protein